MSRIFLNSGLFNVFNAISRYICPVCRGSLEEDRGFWENLKNGFFKVLDRIFQVLSVNHVSFRGISSVDETNLSLWKRHCNECF